jgi:lysophospholipase L1-like esterase
MIRLSGPALALALPVVLVGLGWAVLRLAGGPAADQTLWPPVAGDVAALAAADPLSLVVLGTSLSARNPWPEGLRARLEACRGGPVVLTVVAAPGENSDWGRKQMAAVLAAAPDLVLVEFTINDADLRDGVPLGRSRENHAAILADLAAARPGAVPVLVVLSPAIGLRGALRPFYDRYRALYAQLAEAAGAGLVDLDPVWQAALRAGDRRAILPDGIHPTAAATARITLPPLAARLGPLLGCAEG